MKQPKALGEKVSGRGQVVAAATLQECPICQVDNGIRCRERRLTHCDQQISVNFRDLEYSVVVQLL